MRWSLSTADRRRAIGGLFAAVLIISAPAVGQEAGVPGVEVFPPEYFASASPADAFDMVRRLPGFQLIDVDEDVRGFTGSRGNVLFDGREPSGKQESLEQALKRIPASSVLRIELIRGGAGGAATGNYELVANIVRKSSTSNSASALAGITAADEIGARPDFRVEFSKQGPERRLEGAIALETDVDDESGRGSILTQPISGGSEREARDEREIERTLSADAEYKLPLGSGEMVGGFGASRALTKERVRSSEDGVSEIATEEERLWSGELSGQYDTSVGSGEIEALLVGRRGWLDHNAEEEDERFAEDTRTSETIGRVEYRRGAANQHFYGSLEAAYNQLTSDTKLTADGLPVEIAGSDVNVDERRIEGAIGTSWQAARSVQLEPSLRAELSNIRATGDSPSNETFFFLKPRVRATWEHGRSRFQATIEREAAQLDFHDFVASAELDRDDILVGAPSLHPPATWSISGMIEQRFWPDAVLTLTYRREWIDDVIDRVVVEQGGELFDAVGNIGPGERRIFRAELTAPLARLGLAGMEVRGSLTFLHSRVTDPVTGKKRIISEDKPFEGDLSLTHDIPGGKWSWGVDVEFGEEEREFRLDEVRHERVRTALGMYVEFRPVSDWRLRLEAENLTSRMLIDRRDHFDGSRSDNVLDETETRRIKTSPIISVSVRRAFGAGLN
jgi:hypothetical protein